MHRDEKTVVERSRQPRAVRRGRRAGLCALVLLALVLLASGCGTHAPVPGVELPAEYVDRSTRESSWVELGPEGVGTFTEVPVSTGDGCAPETLAPYSGEVRWHAERGYVVVDELVDGTLERAVVIWPTARFGKDHWDRVMVGACGEDTPREDLVPYVGTFDWGRLLD